MTDVVDLLRQVRDTIDVSPAPVGEAIQQGRRLRRGRRVIGATAAALLVAGAAVALVGLPDSTKPGVVGHVDNPVNLPWWGDDVLHLESVQVAVKGLQGLVVVPDGVVYADDRGEVVHVGDDGRRVVIGKGVSAGQLASNQLTGWVAWVDNGKRIIGNPPVVVVYDTILGEEVAWNDVVGAGARSNVLDEGAHPIAIDGRTVWFAALDGDWSWKAGKSSPVKRTRWSTYVFDVANGTRIAQKAESDRLTWHGGSVLGSGGSLSPDGRSVLTWKPNVARDPLLYRDEKALPTGLEAGTQVETGAFGPDGTITYVVGTGSPYRLVTCTVATAACQTVVSGIESQVQLPR
jgi:hypothetical protein